MKDFYGRQIDTLSERIAAEARRKLRVNAENRGLQLISALRLSGTKLTFVDDGGNRIRLYTEWLIRQIADHYVAANEKDAIDAALSEFLTNLGETKK